MFDICSIDSDRYYVGVDRLSISFDRCYIGIDRVSINVRWIFYRC